MLLDGKKKNCATPTYSTSSITGNTSSAADENDKTQEQKVLAGSKVPKRFIHFQQALKSLNTPSCRVTGPEYLIQQDWRPLNASNGVSRSSL